MRVAICLLAVLLCSGCFVMDEIEKGHEIMDTHSPDASRREGPATAENAAGANKTARQRLTEYYAEQRAKAGPPKKSDDPGDAIGQCRIGTSTKFIRRSDCQLRGGTFR